MGDKCTRCGNRADKLKPILTINPGGHSLPSSQSSKLMSLDRVCSGCITDDELARILGPVVAFVLGVL
jgi:hypothetical protein